MSQVGGKPPPRFSIDRGPVREGLAVSIANRGVFVRQIDERAASDTTTCAPPRSFTRR